MLIITRKIGERVFIGKDICVTYLGKAGGRIRLGIDARDEDKILREEIAPENHPLSTESVNKVVDNSYTP